MSNLKLEKKHRTFGGHTEFYSHDSDVTKTQMKFSVFRPSKEGPYKTLIWLSGLTCSEENFMIKAGAQRWAEELQMMIIAPDTSPRGLDLPGEHDTYDFGSGAGFYLNATQSPWSEHYKMEDYIVSELYQLILEEFPIDSKRIALSGHSMGGHGALTLGLKYPDKFHSLSAFSPISSPIRCPWGQKAFKSYLGNDEESWKSYDAIELLKSKGSSKPLLLHQGDADEFLKEQLNWDLLISTARDSQVQVKAHLEAGYDHSFFFVSSFIKQHLDFHCKQLA